MKLFSFSKKNQDIMPQDLPWNDRPSIFEHIHSNLDSSGRLMATYDLPDEESRYKNESIRWAPGAMDGVFGRHGSPGSQEKEARRIADLVKAISEKNGLAEKITLYNILSEDATMGFIDPALEKIVGAKVPIDPHLHNYARWLAFESPDRGAVKFGIALLGLICDRSDIDKVIILGKHEEFTLFSAVAITNSLPNAEQELWELAKCVEGWGKIHLVERLANTGDRAIKEWLLREGYKNSVMYEYSAYTCAVAGELKIELSEPKVSADVLGAAGDIIVALITGGPAENMDDYEDGAEVTRLYLMHLENKADNLNVFLNLTAIKNFLEDNEADWAERDRKGWSVNLRSDLLIDLHKNLSDTKWKQMVLENRNTADDAKFWQVTQAASILDISLWETHWERLLNKPLDSSCWYNVMKNANHERITQIVALAVERLSLSKIATGPADEMGFGPAYDLHGCLDYLLQDLGDYPGHGFELVKTGLASPVTRNRNMAIRTLSSWGAKQWPHGTSELLMQARKNEPNENTRKNIDNLLAGKELE